MNWKIYVILIRCRGRHKIIMDILFIYTLVLLNPSNVCSIIISYYNVKWILQNIYIKYKI